MTLATIATIIQIVTATAATFPITSAAMGFAAWPTAIVAAQAVRLCLICPFLIISLYTIIINFFVLLITSSRQGVATAVSVNQAITALTAIVILQVAVARKYTVMRQLALSFRQPTTTPFFKTRSLAIPGAHNIPFATVELNVHQASASTTYVALVVALQSQTPLPLRKSDVNAGP